VRPGRDADPSPSSSAEVKNRAIPLLSLRAFVAYERVKPTYISQLVIHVAYSYFFRDKDIPIVEIEYYIITSFV
jgi:hypothetical protein